MIKTKTYINAYRIMIVRNIILFLIKDIILENLNNSQLIRNIYNVILLSSLIIIIIILAIVGHRQNKEDNKKTDSSN